MLIMNFCSVRRDARFLRLKDKARRATIAIQTSGAEADSENEEIKGASAFYAYDPSSDAEFLRADEDAEKRHPEDLYIDYPEHEDEIVAVVC